MFRFLKTYSKAKGTWKRPRFEVFIGLWKNNPNAPHIKNPLLRLGKYGQYYMIQKSVTIEDKTRKETTTDGHPIKVMKRITTGRIKQDYAWRRDIRKKLRKFGLGWLPPIITLPRFLKFGVYDYDLGWKPKYDDFRYEYPPQFTIVAFGLSLSITLHEPTGGYYTCDDQYWEGILAWLYGCDKDIYKTVMHEGVWTRHSGERTEAFFSVRPEHLINLVDFQEYCRATQDYNSKNTRYNAC